MGEFVIYSNFGSGMSFNTGFPQWSLGRGQSISQQFTPSASYIFDDAEVAVSGYRGPNSAIAYLQADSNGLPGAVIEGIPIVAPGGPGTPTIVKADSALFPVLHSGAPYWLTLVGVEPRTPTWNFNSIGDESNSTFAFTETGSPLGPWEHPGFSATRGAFEIEGRLSSPIMEPTSLAILGTALIGLSLMIRRRRQLQGRLIETQ